MATMLDIREMAKGKLYVLRKVRDVWSQRYE